MCARRVSQPLTYDLRLPDEAQADALRLLDVSRAVVNQVLTILWPNLEDFAADGLGPAWKQVGRFLSSPHPHGDRQWRGESEMAGRILRGQAERKAAFDLIAPLLSTDLLRPATEKQPQGKNRTTIKDRVSQLRQSLDAGESNFILLQNVMEQACNHFAQHDEFPKSYQQMQPLPLLKVGMLTYAGDDGGKMGQSYRMSLPDKETLLFRFRYPDESGRWQWRKEDLRLPLPPLVQQRLLRGSLMAPTLREHIQADGKRIAVLDLIVEVEKEEMIEWQRVERVLGADWGVKVLLTATVVDVNNEQVGRPFFLDTGGFDGRQARTRRQIDQLKKCIALGEKENRSKKLALWRRELDRCWKKYEKRNRTLAHLASNVLILLMTLHDCTLLSMESLKTLKTTGRGRGVRGRFRNYRNNSTIRGEIWRLLRYKCSMYGIRFHSEYPRGTSHTCPSCGRPADTFASPDHRRKRVNWGKWLWCVSCSFNCDRDLAGSLNVGRLGIAYLKDMKRSGKSRYCPITDPRVKPLSYTGRGSVLLLPPTSRALARNVRGKISYVPGWIGSAFLQSSQPKGLFLRLCS